MIHMAFLLSKADIKAGLRERALTIEAAKSYHPYAIRESPVTPVRLIALAFAMRTGPRHEPEAKQNERKT